MGLSNVMNTDRIRANFLVTGKHFLEFSGKDGEEVRGMQVWAGMLRTTLERPEDGFRVEKYFLKSPEDFIGLAECPAVYSVEVEMAGTKMRLSGFRKIAELDAQLQKAKSA